jgi:hypothetical protein
MRSVHDERSTTVAPVSGSAEWDVITASSPEHIDACPAERLQGKGSRERTDTTRMGPRWPKTTAPTLDAVRFQHVRSFFDT